MAYYSPRQKPYSLHLRINQSKSNMTQSKNKKATKATEPKWEDYTAFNFSGGGMSASVNILHTDVHKIAAVFGDFLKERGIDCIVTTEQRP